MNKFIRPGFLYRYSLVRNSNTNLTSLIKSWNLVNKAQCTYIYSAKQIWYSQNFNAFSGISKNALVVVHDDKIGLLKTSQIPKRSVRWYSSNKANDDDLQRILKDNSLGLFAKFKILFKQYGLVVMVVHILTAAVWIAIFYVAVSRGIDVIPILEKYGVISLLEKIPGMPSAEKIKNSGAKDWLLVYLLYEIFKPIRYIVTIFGTVFAIRYLRKFNYMKSAPKIEKQMKEIISTSRHLLQHRMKKTANKYSNKYRNSRLSSMQQKYTKRYRNFKSRHRRRK